MSRKAKVKAKVKSIINCLKSLINLINLRVQAQFQAYQNFNQTDDKLPHITQFNLYLKIFQL